MAAPRKTAEPPLDWLAGLLAGDRAALARAITAVENGTGEAAAVLAAIQPRLGRAKVVGITGAPGVGKSTLTGAYVAELRRRDLTVGVVAVDPSSPLTGGALLGDRIRMTVHGSDPGVFVRSVAARGHLGGLSRTTARVIDVMDAAGKDVVIVETVGAGQSEVEIAGLADVNLVVSAPGLGDDIQAIKAGLLEIADVHVVSKCDRADANATIADIKGMLSLGVRIHAPGDGTGDGGWQVSVVPTSADRNEGIEDLLAAIDGHAKHLADTGGIEERRRQILEMRVLKTAEDILRKDFKGRRDRLKGLMGRLVSGEMDPHEAAVELLGAFDKD